MKNRVRHRTATVGSLQLKNPVLTASGTSGHGIELDTYVPLRDLGGVVVKSLAAFLWEGNPAPRLRPTSGGMLNSVGLQGNGITHWIENDLPSLTRVGATVVASIWGFTVDDYVEAVNLLAQVRNQIVAIEVNLSCPNIHRDTVGSGRSHPIFAHDPVLAGQIIAAAAKVGIPLWAKLSPTESVLVDVARACVDSGAQALTLVNTALGMVIDTNTGRPALGNGGGGLSGRAIHPLAVRAVFDVRSSIESVPIIGVGGVTCAQDAVELMMAGACAVQVGTANFAEPRATLRIIKELEQWADDRGIGEWVEICGVAHRGGLGGGAPIK